MRDKFLRSVLIASLTCSMALMPFPAYSQVSKPVARIVSSCGTPPYTYAVGQSEQILQDTTGTQCTAGGSGGGGGTVTQGPAAVIGGGWPITAGEPVDTTGTFTNATQNGNVTTPSVDGYASAIITIHGTYGTATATFLVSDDGGTTFYPLACNRTDGTSLPENGYSSLTNSSQAWICATQGFDEIRVLSSAVASGTVNVRISQSAAPIQAPVQQNVTVINTPNVAVTNTPSVSATIAGPLGSALSAASIPVVIASDQAALNVSSGVAQGSTTSGQTGALIQCATLTAAPTKTTATTNAVSCDVNQNIRTLDTLAPGSTIQAIPGTTNGLSFATITAANSTNATNLKNAAGQLYHLTAYNNSATLAWVSFYNTAGTPTCGTGIVYQAMIPANSTSGAGVVEDIPDGLTFATGIGYCITTGIAGTGSVAATSYVVNFGYK